MKIFRLFGVLIFSVCLLSTSSCGEDPVVFVPVGIKILGVWKQTEAKEESVVVALDEYQTLEFISDLSAIIRLFDSSDIEIDSTNDMWELLESDTKINFDVSEDLEIVEITDTQLIVKYQGTNLIGQPVEKEDTYQKQ